jgi:hypothetical protein
MKWTLGLLLLGAVGCGYRQTGMVACPETGCPQNYASSSPEGLPGPKAHPQPAPLDDSAVVPAPPIEPLPDPTPMPTPAPTP